MKYVLLEFCSMCCSEISIGIFPLHIVKGEFDYTSACRYLTETYGHIVAITSWREIDEATAISIGRWTMWANEKLGGPNLEPQLHPRMTTHAPKREEPKADRVDNVIYPKAWKKPDEKDPTDPGPTRPTG